MALPTRQPQTLLEVLADGLPTSWSPTSPRSPGLLSQIPNDEHNWAYDKGRVQRRTAALELHGTMLLFFLLVDFQQGLAPQQLHNPPHGVGMPPTAATDADMGATHKCANITHTPTFDGQPGQRLHSPEPQRREVAMLRDSGRSAHRPTPKIATWQCNMLRGIGTHGPIS